MPTRVKSITGHQRHPLVSGWELCSAVPGAYDHPEALRRAPTAWLPARVPSTAAECLQAAELWSLDAPPRRFDSDDWWYRVTFPRPQHRPHERLVLGFDGLATLADVWLNGEPLFSSTNMFVAHECALDERIADTNELVICFPSARSGAGGEAAPAEVAHADGGEPTAALVPHHAPRPDARLVTARGSGGTMAAGLAGNTGARVADRRLPAFGGAPPRR